MLKRIMPQSIEGQMIAVLTLSFSLLLAMLAMLEIRDNKTVDEWVQSDFTINRLFRITSLIETISREERADFVAAISRCHDGYELSRAPYGEQIEHTTNMARDIGHELSLPPDSIRISPVEFGRNDFSYGLCAAGEMSFPFMGMVISLRVAPDQWLNAEVHPHEWHITSTMTGWFIRSGIVFLLVGVVAFSFVRRLSRPINNLTDAAKSFGIGLEVAEVEETGPRDVKRAIRSFNAMQCDVANEVKRRSNTLAAISHDVRSPLTALRLKVEFVDNDEVRTDLIRSIEKMDRITTSALEFLKGESRTEPKRVIDLGALVESECAEFRELGAKVSFNCSEIVHYSCRPDALARAIRNVIENAIKYAGSAEAAIRRRDGVIEIIVSDSGPGIPNDKVDLVLEPFERLSSARESNEGGFGFGLAIAKAVTEGHDGVFELAPNTPHGLRAIMRLPAVAL